MNPSFILIIVSLTIQIKIPSTLNTLGGMFSNIHLNFKMITKLKKKMFPMAINLNPNFFWGRLKDYLNSSIFIFTPN